MRVTGEVVISAPRPAVWEVIADASTYPTFMEGVTRWESRTDGPTQVGSRWLARLMVGSAPVGALVEVVEFEEPCDLAWASVTGLEHRGRWRLRDAGEGATRVNFRLAYQAPGGVLGLLADRAAGPMVQRIVDDSLAALKARVEGSRVRRPHRPNPVAIASSIVHAGAVLAATGAVAPIRPDRLVAAAAAVAHWGMNPAATAALSAARFPDAPAVIDDRGMVTYRQLDERTNALARALVERFGVGPTASVGILCRNHAGFVEACLALAKAGAPAVLLNTGFGAEQLADVCRHEGVELVVCDPEFAPAVASTGLPSVHAWGEPPTTNGQRRRPGRRSPTIDELVASAPTSAPPAPARAGRVVILTSGTTGRPKGAPREQSGTVDAAVSLLSRIPYRVRDTTVLAPPLFHAWGYANLLAGLALSSTLVLRRRFDPTVCLSDISTHRARTLVAVPVMLQRLLELPPGQRQGFDTSTLQVVAVSGSAIPGPTVTRFMDEFGDVLYNLYGSTEVAWATIADPRQLRAVPTTAGTPPRGTTVRILDDCGIELPRGQRGRIFVANGMGFEGYTGGGDKTVIRGLLDTGDVGFFDTAGRLMVEGRSDDMIVSGGENVFPQEVEELLAGHAAVADVAVVGVADDQFGQRLAAFVVRRPRASVGEDELKSLVRDRLARHKVPRSVTFLDELPRNPTGKILRRELARRAMGAGEDADPGPAAGRGRTSA